MICCFSVVFCYNLLISVWKPGIDVAASQWSLNRIKAERYIYEPIQPSAVIVGTSLAMALPQEGLGSQTVNLSLGAVGPLTGLEIVRRARSRPVVVIIETNLFAREVDEEFVDALFSPGAYLAREVFPALRHEFQPVNVAINFARRQTKRSSSESFLERPNPEIFRRMLEVNRGELDRVPSASAMDAALAKLKSYIATLESRGVKLIFLKMPVHHTLQKSYVIANNIARLKEAFPDSQYRWVAFDHHGEVFQTKDGLHLIYPDALIVSRRLRSEIESAIEK